MTGDTRSNTLVKETPFSIAIEKTGDAAVVHLRGSCTMTVAPKLTDAMIRLSADPFRLVIVEMSELDFLESTGLGGIVAGYLKLRRKRGEVCLVSPAPAIRNLLDLTRLTQLFRVFDRVDEALASSKVS